MRKWEKNMEKRSWLLAREHSKKISCFDCFLIKIISNLAKLMCACCQIYKSGSLIAQNLNLSCARLALFAVQDSAARWQNKQKWRKICLFSIEKYFLVSLALAVKFTSLQSSKIEIMTIKIRYQGISWVFSGEGTLSQHITNIYSKFWNLPKGPTVRAVEEMIQCCFKFQIERLS